MSDSDSDDLLLDFKISSSSTRERKAPKRFVDDIEPEVDEYDLKKLAAEVFPHIDMVISSS